MISILLVDDKILNLEALEELLASPGYNLIKADSGPKALKRLLVDPDRVALIILDVQMPTMDGFETAKLIQQRDKTKNIPIIFISAEKIERKDIFQGYALGAFDYMTKPFSFSELLARVHALIRRSTRVAEPSTLHAGDLTLDLLTREVERGKEEISLPSREFALLEHLVRNKGRIVSKTSILEHVYDYSFDPQTNVVDVLVCRVRNKIDKDFDKKLIHTVRGMGYVLKEQ